MRSLVLALGVCLALAAQPAAAGPTAGSAARIPVTADYFDGSKRVIRIARERPRKDYKVTVGFADTRERVIRWMRSGQTIRIEVGNRPHSLQIRCVPRKKR